MGYHTVWGGGGQGKVIFELRPEGRAGIHHGTAFQAKGTTSARILRLEGPKAC